MPGPRLARPLRLLGLAALGAIAAAGVLLSAAVAFTASAPGRPVVARLVVRQLDGLLAGTLALGGIELQPTGVELRDLEVRDPAGRTVLRVRRGRLTLDLRQLHRRAVGLTAELDGAAVLLETLPDGGLGLARALSPARPAAPGSDDGSAGPGRPAWTLRLTRLTVRDGEVLWLGAGGETRLEATALEADGTGSWGPRGGAAQLAVRAAMAAPARGSLSLEVAASLDGDRLTVPLARASLGATSVEALGELDVRRLAGRVALARLGLASDQARALAPRAAPGGDLAASGYAESDGERATAFLEVRPDGRGPAAGEARLAAAARGLPPKALGFDAMVRELDPSRLVAAAPAGRVSLTASGAAAGTGLADARGRLDLQVAASSLGAGSFGPAALRATAAGGRVQVGRLEAHLPGLTVSGAGEWRDRGPISGRIALDAADLARFAGNLAALGVPALPAIQGRLRAQASLSGTRAAPALHAAVEAPRLVLGESRAEDLAADAEVTGPLAGARLRAVGRAARLAVGGLELRAVSLDGALAGDEASLELLGTLPSGEGGALSIRSAGRLSRDRRTLTVQELALAWPGARYQLVAPAALALEGPSVDWLELADGERRLAAGGGFGPRGALDARVSVIALDLARLPRGLLPAGVAGELTVEARATGSAARPALSAHLLLAGGAAAGLDGLTLQGDASWDAAARRLAGSVTLGRDGGGTMEASADLPLPLGRARRDALVALRASIAGLQLDVLRRAAGLEAPVAGTASARLALSGTVGSPALEATVGVEDGRIGDVGPLSAQATIEAPGATGRLALTVDHAGARLLSASAEAPLDVAGLLARPVEVVRGLARAPLHVAADVPGADLGAFAGRAGLPEGLAGTLVARAALAGSLSAPRGTVEVSATEVALHGYRGLAAAVTAVLGPERTEVAGRVAAGGDEALRLAGSLGAPVEALAERAALGRAPLALEVQVPPTALAQAAGPALPLAGTVAARFAARGSLAEPEISLEADGEELSLDGRALGDLQAAAGYSAGSARAELAFRGSGGGRLQAAATLRGRLGLGADAAALAKAPVEARLSAARLDLGLLAALLPGIVRSASGALDAELSAAGPLEALVPKGTLKLEDGRVAISEYGAWTGVSVSASSDGRSLRLDHLAARRGKGGFRAELSASELGTEKGSFSGRVVMDKLAVVRAGMDLVTLDLTAELAGTLRPGLVDATLTVPGGTIRLPKKAPRALQDLEDRPDVVVERPGAQRQAGAPAGRPLEVRLRLVAPGKVFVKGDSPRIDVEGKTDTTWRWAGGELLAEGPVELVRGSFEPIGGRSFVVDRGRVQFTGAGYGKGQLEAVARWESTQAEVTVTVGGTVEKPTIALTSRPAMDEASIVTLLATGRTELRAGTSEIGSLSSGTEVGSVDSTGTTSGLDTRDLGLAAAGAVTTMLFNDLLSDKVPVDSIAVDSTAVRAGKYLPGGKFFVQYIRRFEADPEKNENSDEVRVEYQITPRWTLESRYGNAMTGGASLIWSRDY